MKFIIVFKKSGFQRNAINSSFLSSCTAPSLISKECIKKEAENFDVYIYTYDHILKEDDTLVYEIDADFINLFNGLIALEDNDNNIQGIFKTINENKLVLGDYQAVHLDASGNGYIKTPKASLYPLFHYEDEYCSVISNELKLIVDGVNAIDGQFISHLNGDYLYEIYDHGYFYNGKRFDQRATAFSEIKKVLPQDSVTFHDNQIEIKENDSIEIPEWFESWYLEDKDSLYDWYYDNLMRYSDSMVNFISGSISEIALGLSGGFDSRLTVLVLERLCKKYNIALKTNTTGDPNHPDVVIAKRIAELLDLNWTNSTFSAKDNLKPTPQHLRDYAMTFFMSQGDFDSHDFEPTYSRLQGSEDFVNQFGIDFYKRDSDSAIINYNRWFSRRTLSRRHSYLPIFGTDLEIYFALLFNKHCPKKRHYREFVYNVLKRGNPDLLEIPFALDRLPQLDIEAYKNDDYVSTSHKLEPYLWDYNFVLTELGPLLEAFFNEKSDSIISKTDLNPLDYFLLKKDIGKLLKKHSKKDTEKIIREINRLKENSFYPQSRVYLEIDLKEKNYMKKRSLMKLMDYSSAAGFSSFDELGKYYVSNSYDSKEEIYRKFDEIEKDKMELTSQKDKLKGEMDELMSSNSWKITKPLRRMRNKK